MQVTCKLLAPFVFSTPTTVFLADIQDFAAMNAVYGEYFKTPYPARSCFQVAALPMGAKVEIEVTCARGTISANE